MKESRNFAAQNMSNRREKNKPRNAINKQLEHKEKEKDDNLIQFGKFLYSLSALTYAGVVLTGTMDFKVEKVVTITLGALAMLALAIFAWTFVKRGNIKK